MGDRNTQPDNAQPDNRKPKKGMGLGPLLAFVYEVDPAIVTALLGSTLVFVCFSIAALLAERGSQLYLLGIMGTMIGSVSLTGLARILMPSILSCQTHLYLGLALMCGLVLFDTQFIIEKRRAGNEDFILHALVLFMDFTIVFPKLLLILTRNEQDRRRRRE